MSGLEPDAAQMLALALQEEVNTMAHDVEAYKALRGQVMGELKQTMLDVWPNIDFEESGPVAVVHRAARLIRRNCTRTRPDLEC